MDGFDLSKHSGVIAHINQCYRKGSFRRIYLLLLFLREKSDYDDFYIANREEAEQQLQNAEIELLMYAKKFLEFVKSEVLYAYYNIWRRRK